MVIIITGASKGIGFTLAETLAKKDMSFTGLADRLQIASILKDFLLMLQIKNKLIRQFLLLLKKKEELMY